MPAASTSSTSSPSAAIGSGCWLTTSFSGPPNSVRWMARISPTLPSLLRKRRQPLVEALPSELSRGPQSRIGQQGPVAHRLPPGARHRQSRGSGRVCRWLSRMRAPSWACSRPSGRPTRRPSRPGRRRRVRRGARPPRGRRSAATPSSASDSADRSSRRRRSGGRTRETAWHAVRSRAPRRRERATPARSCPRSSRTQTSDCRRCRAARDGERLPPSRHPAGSASLRRRRRANPRPSAPTPRARR